MIEVPYFLSSHEADVIWTTIAQAEAHVHNADIAELYFHEVGRMSNILADLVVAELFIAMDPAVCQPSADWR